MLFSHASSTSRSSRPTSGSLLDSYRVRVLLSLAASLALVLLVTRLPFLDTVARVGWQGATSSSAERMPVEMPRPEAPAPMQGAPLTAFSTPDETPKDEGEAADARREEEAAPSPNALPPIQKLKASRLIVENPDQAPRIAGGPGRLFMHIRYPEAARREGIQGRVVLDFVVTQDGRTEQIHVAETLHPLCDSSAVRAVRQTRFVPGRQRGEPVRVRMRLPVRFQLLNAPAAPEEAPAEREAQAGASSSDNDATG